MQEFLPPICLEVFTQPTYLMFELTIGKKIYVNLIRYNFVRPLTKSFRTNTLPMLTEHALSLTVFNERIQYPRLPTRRLLIPVRKKKSNLPFSQGMPRCHWRSKCGEVNPRTFVSVGQQQAPNPKQEVFSWAKFQTCTSMFLYRCFYSNLERPKFSIHKSLQPSCNATHTPPKGPCR